jgi:hypothetical protein
VDIAELYLEAQRSFVAICGELTDDEWRSAVPCTPEWSVWDVLSHVAGVTDDIVHARVEGAATDPWTALQVERWRGTPRTELIEQWNEQIERAADMVQAVGEGRPPLDCHNHEHDVRQALGRPGNRESDIVRFTVERFGDVSVGRPVAVEFSDGGSMLLDRSGDRISLRGISRFEFMRSRLGRRSRSQVAAYGWSEPPSEELLDEWFAFGPSPIDIDE